jgi:hypothetical protein
LALSTSKQDKTAVYTVTRLPAAPYVPAFQILKVGAEKADAVKLLDTFAKLNPGEAAQLLDQPYGEFRNLREFDVNTVTGEFKGCGTVVAPAIRIFRATPAARQQLQMLIERWKK